MAEYKARRARKRATGGSTGEGGGPPHGHMIIMIGLVKKPKKGGKVEGAAASKHLGKRARGGKADGGALDAREDSHEPAESGRDKVSQRSGTEERAVEMGDPRARGGSTCDDDEDTGERKRGGALTASARRKLPSSEFALPGRGEGPGGKGSGSYPIPDASHARNALSRVSQFGSSAEKSKVRSAVHRKFPDIGQG